MGSYSVVVDFVTDRELAADELDRLVVAMVAQVEDPAGLESDQKRAEFVTLSATSQVFTK